MIRAKGLVKMLITSTSTIIGFTQPGPGVENMRPIMFIAAEHDQHERNNTQHGGKRDIACHIGRSGYQSDNVIDQDKEKYCEQDKACIFPICRPGLALPLHP